MDRQEGAKLPACLHRASATNQIGDKIAVCRMSHIQGTSRREGMFLIVGELINSSRKHVGEAIKEKDDASIRRLARSQIEAGAHVVDLNAGQSMEQEPGDLLWLIEVVGDADDVQGILRKPYTMEIENGVVTAVKGGLEANKMRRWMETRDDEAIYHLCHFSSGINPKAQLSANFTEGERLLGCVDFGFGDQPQGLGGTVGSGLYHMDSIVASPTVYLDGKVMSEKNQLNHELGFVEG